MSRRRPPDPDQLCACGRTATIVVDGIAFCRKHRPARKKRVLEWDQPNLLDDTVKREKVTWYQ